MPSNRANRRAAALQRQRRRRAVAIAIVAVAVIVAGAIVITRAVDTRDDEGTEDSPAERVDRTGSTPIERTADLEIEPIAEYRIVYRVDDFAGGTAVASTEHLRVRRPFESRLERRTGPPPGEDDAGIQISRLGRLAVPGGDQGSLSLAVPAELAANDFRFEIALDGLVEVGKVERREWREVLGRDCQVHRFGAPLTSGMPEPYAGDESTHADLCIDEAGLVLEEVWTSDGGVLRRRLAVDVAEEVELTEPDLADPAAELTVAEGGGTFERLADDAPPGGPTLEAPSRFRFEGRFRVTAPQSPTSAGQPAQATVMSVVDVWTDGIDVIVLDRGRSTTGAAPFTATVGVRTASITGLGEVELHEGFRMNEVRHLDGPSFTRLRATLPPAELVTLASGLS